MPADLLSIDAFAMLVVFARVGTAIAFLPGFSAAWVSVRIRLVMELALTVLVTPALAEILPPMPATPVALGLLLFRETAIGLFLLVRERAGAGSGHRSAAIAGFFTALGLVLIFVTDLHHLMLRAIVDSYGLFAPGAPPPFDDFCTFITHTVAESFGLGAQLAAPFLVVSLVYNVGLGLPGRLMPQLPVFFFGLPLQVGLQMWVIMLTVSGIMLVFLQHFADMLAGFGGR